MLERDKTILMVVDFQERLLPKIHAADSIQARAVNLIRFARALDLPVVWTEQYKKGLGPTAEAIARELEGIAPHEKMAFGCLGDPGVRDALAASGRTQLLVTGIESHICVMQTTLSALDSGFEAFVVQDAVSSCSEKDHDAGLARMERAGAQLVTAQMAMFEILREAGTPQFKQVLPLLK